MDTLVASHSQVFFITIPCTRPISIKPSLSTQGVVDRVIVGSFDDEIVGAIDTLLEGDKDGISVIVFVGGFDGECVLIFDGPSELSGEDGS